MYQIDVASAAPSLPVPSAAGTPGYFTNGDPVGGAPATVLPAEFLNTVMLELLNILSAGGVQPAKGNPGQVLTALSALFGISGNLAYIGHLTFRVADQSVTINWGAGTLSGSSGGQAVSYDRPYTTGALVTLACNAAGGPPNDFHGTDLGNASGFTVWSASVAGQPAAAGATFRWIAIGKG